MVENGRSRIRAVSFVIIYIDLMQGSGNFEIWIGPADDDDIINEPISKKKKYVYITCHEN